MGILRRILNWASQISICNRIVVANTVVITAGSLIGAWITYHVLGQGASLLELFLIVLAGISISLVLNLILVKTALLPLREVQKFSSEIKSLSNHHLNLTLTNPDPDTCQLANTVMDLVHQLENNNKRLRLITERAINAQEDERRRIARWLHDDTGQALLSLIINLEYLQKKVPPDHLDLKETIQKATQLSKHTLDELRVIIYGLRPSILDDLGLGPAIRWYARTKLEEAGIVTTIKIPETNLEINPRIRTSLFRIAQEAINNIVRHSQAKNATVTLDIIDEEIYLCIEDDGQGFYVAPSSGEAIRLQHWGLIGIQERVELIGGEYNLTAEPGRGVLLQVYAPLKNGIEA